MATTQREAGKRMPAAALRALSDRDLWQQTKSMIRLDWGGQADPDGVIERQLNTYLKQSNGIRLSRKRSSRFTKRTCSRQMQASRDRAFPGIDEMYRRLVAAKATQGTS